MTTSANYQCYGRTRQDFQATHQFRGRVMVKAILFALIGFTISCEGKELVRCKSGPISIAIYPRAIIYTRIEVNGRLLEDDLLHRRSLMLESPLI